MSGYKFIQVALNLPLNDVFDYSVPENYRNKVQVGKRVWVPFGNRTMPGVIVKLGNATDIAKTRDIKSVIDDEPIVSEYMLSLCRWISDYYVCSWGEAIDAAIAMPFKKGRTSMNPRKSSHDLLSGFVSARGKEEKEPIILNSDQKKAKELINVHIRENQFKVFLLHGVTASGKTEVYFEAIDQALALGKKVLVFIPEISLTAQTFERFITRFSKEKVAIIHSRLSAGEKFLQWQKIKKGQAKIVIGPRSAIFSPLDNPGLIIIDEAHENSYKQEDVPRYHLVDTAVKAAELSNTVVVLGTATPCLESYYASEKKRYELIDMPKRIKGMEMPDIQLVDMTTQKIKSKRRTIISKPLEDSIGRCLKSKKQVMLFLNRRGFSTFINCNKCGHVLSCSKCNLSLVFHFDKKMLVCHHCGFEKPAVQVCPECNDGYIDYLGIGTQKVESNLHRLFPNARIARMDSDSVKKKTAHFNIFSLFKTGKIDILIGTQMIAKGLDFPNVGLVGVISADVSLNLPDFRASERTFSLLMQVSGRTGRSTEKGKVIIQTYTPEHYAIKRAIEHDYLGFYKQEMEFRKRLDLPPFKHMINIVLRSKDEKMLIENCEKLAGLISEQIKKNNMPVLITGPMVMPVSKLRNNFRWGIMLQTEDILRLSRMVKHIIRKNRMPGKIKVAVDVDPRMVV